MLRLADPVRVKARGCRREPFDIQLPATASTRHRQRSNAGRRSSPTAEAEEYLKLTNKVRVHAGGRDLRESRSSGDEQPTPTRSGRRVFDGIRESAVLRQDDRGLRHGRHAVDHEVPPRQVRRLSRAGDGDPRSRDGVPVRWEQGFPLPFPEGGVAEGGRARERLHRLALLDASFYAPSHGWVPMDVSEGDKGVNVNSEFYFGNLCAESLPGVRSDAPSTLHPEAGRRPPAHLRFRLCGSGRHSARLSHELRERHPVRRPRAWRWRDACGG